MRIGRRYGLSSAQKTEIWRRWKAGESLHEIGRAFGKDHGSIHFLLSQHGGIVPAVRQRSERTLKHLLGPGSLQEKVRRRARCRDGVGRIDDLTTHGFALADLPPCFFRSHGSRWFL
jgi:hypothetical protein